MSLPQGRRDIGSAVDQHTIIASPLDGQKGLTMKAYFDIDITNTAHLTALATLAQAGITVTLGESASPAASDKPAKASKPRTYAAVHDITCVWHVADNGGVTYTHADGSYVCESGVRKVLNARLRSLGGTWDKNARVWVLPTDARPEDGSAADVTAEEWQAVRDAAAARAARRAAAR